MAVCLIVCCNLLLCLSKEECSKSPSLLTSGVGTHALVVVLILKMDMPIMTAGKANCIRNGRFDNMLYTLANPGSETMAHVAATIVRKKVSVPIIGRILVVGCVT